MAAGWSPPKPAGSSPISAAANTGSSFWTLGREIAEALIPDRSLPWYAHIAWANV
jgi:hypothetical protein